MAGTAESWGLATGQDLRSVNDAGNETMAGIDDKAEFGIFSKQKLGKPAR